MALVCVLVEDSAWWCVLASVCAVAVLTVVRRARGADARGGTLALVVLAVGGAVALGVAFATPARQEAVSWDGRVVEARGTVTSSSSVGSDGRLWMELQLSALGAPGTVEPVSAPVRVGIGPGDGYDLGADVVITGEAAATGQGERPALVVFASTARVERAASGVFAVAAGAREAFISRSGALPEPGAGLLPGLAVGDTRAVSATLDDDMRASGLSHLTAVSGANCAIVVGAAFWISALCGAGRAVRVAVGATSLAAFVVLVTPEPSVVRAAVMSGVAMTTVLLGRPTAGAGLLALCATGILLADPWLATTPGFALSVVASGALILLARPLARGMRRWMPAPIATAVAVPLAAQVACSPIIALFAEQQSLVGVAANMIADPAAPIATVIGLLACLAAPVPMIADLLAASAWLPASWIAMTATVSARLPLAQVTVAPGLGGAALVAAVSAATAVLLVGPARHPVVWRVPWGRRRSTNGPHSDGPVWAPLRLLHMASAGVVTVTVSLTAAHGLLTGPLAVAATPDGWSIAACDVGQGDALVVRSAGRIALIDTGPEPGPLEECLRSLGIERIDLLVLTHFDLDHVGGASALVGRVSTVLHGPAVRPSDERVLADLAGGGAVVESVSQGRTGTLGDAEWRVHWPLADDVVFPSGNDASVVMEIHGGGVPRSIFLGDLSAASQRLLARRAALTGGYAVVKVAHHGSADQDADLYRALRPRVALISVGAGNDYGHPRQETLALLTASGAEVLRTDLDGRVLLAVRAGTLEIWTDGDVRAPG